MNSIPWEWQLVVSFAVPLISAVGAYWVATMTARRADARRGKDQDAEEARRQQDRDDRERERQEQLRRETNTRQRRAVAELSSTFKRAWDRCVEQQTAVVLAGEIPLQTALVRKASAVTGFYREIHQSLVLAELELGEGELLDQLLVLRRIVTRQADELAELRLYKDSAATSYLEATAGHPTMTSDIQDQLMVVEMHASKLLRG